MASAVYTPTASQLAAAACHMELRHEPLTRWATVRKDGVRYLTVTSGTSGRLYLVRATLDGCGCRHYEKCGRQCSHVLAVHLADLEDDLREPAPVTIQELRAAWPGCAGACGNLADDGRQFCSECAAVREREQRLAAARARVLAEWTQEEAG